MQGGNLILRTLRIGSCRLAGDTDSIQKREFGSVSLSNRYRKWYSRLSTITHEVRSRDYGFCIDGFVMEVIREIKVVANLGIN